MSGFVAGTFGLSSHVALVTSRPWINHAKKLVLGATRLGPPCARVGRDQSDLGARQLRVGIAELGKLFDGSEKVVSIAVLPWYLRQVLLP